VNRYFLLTVYRCSRSVTARGLARSALEGDFLALPLLWDYVHESGVGLMQSLKVGECYLIRTRDSAYTGRVRAASFTDVVLGEAAWLPHMMSGYHEALRNGDLSHVEPYPDEVILSTAVIIDAARWLHPLPRDLKRPLLPSQDDVPF
jgi:hypothetical protein